MSKLPVTWIKSSLNDVCNVVNGGTPKTGVDSYWGGKHYWVTPAEMGKRSNPYISETRRKLTNDGLGNTSAKLVPPFSVILSTRAPIGHLVINKVPMAFNQGCRGLVPNDDLNYRFLYYFLMNSISLLNDLGTGATFKELSAGKLKAVNIPVPPLQEQQRIVSILDKAFESIDQAIASTEKNLANARELFESYLNNVFTQKGKGWVEVSLSDVCQLISGQHIDSKDYNIIKKGIGYLTGPSDFGLINPVVSKWTEHPKRTALLNDILVTVKGSGVGKANLMTHGELAISRQLMAIRSNEVNIKLLYRFIKTRYSYFQSLANGAAIPGISRPDVLGLTLSLPKRSLQNELAIKIDNIANEVDNLDEVYKKKIFSLNELKQSLLQKAFSGQLS